MTGTEIALKWIESQIDKQFDYLTYQNQIMSFASNYTSKFYRLDSWFRYLRFALEKVNRGATPFSVKEIDGKIKTWEVQIN